MSFLYVALGDSLTAGVGTGLFSPGFVQRFRRMAEMELDEHVFVQIFAHPGFQTEDILAELDNEFVQEQIQEADIITITGGGNDLIQAARKYLQDQNEHDFSSALKQSMENFHKMMNKMTNLKKNSSKPYIVRIINLYNPFPTDPLAAKWIKKFNQLIKSFSVKNKIAIVQIDKAFKDYEKEYLSIDGVHPNDVGHERIAESLHRLGYGEIIYEVEEE
ncbi:GDSL-type esterase/lipase family protein [Neobacillus sp. SM06]|uniref:GDSL-type esterase/lipase family protein n=1 Tax=Neobacillus sp. SM06 TaxID=3422492 RepID=UPI003D288ACB